MPHLNADAVEGTRWQWVEALGGGAEVWGVWGAVDHLGVLLEAVLALVTSWVPLCSV